MQRDLERYKLKFPDRDFTACQEGFCKVTQKEKSCFKDYENYSQSKFDRCFDPKCAQTRDIEFSYADSLRNFPTIDVRQQERNEAEIKYRDSKKKEIEKMKQLRQYFTKKPIRFNVQ